MVTPYMRGTPVEVASQANQLNDKQYLIFMWEEDEAMQDVTGWIGELLEALRPEFVLQVNLRKRSVRIYRARVTADMLQ